MLCSGLWCAWKGKAEGRGRQGSLGILLSENVGYAYTGSVECVSLCLVHRVSVYVCPVATLGE